MDLRRFACACALFTLGLACSSSDSGGGPPHDGSTDAAEPLPECERIIEPVGACVAPTLDERLDAGLILTVGEPIAADSPQANECFAGGARLGGVGEQSLLRYSELLDDSGSSFTVGFALPTTDLPFRPGDRVQVRRYIMGQSIGANGGFISVERDGATVALVGFGQAPGLDVSEGDRECFIDSCLGWHRRALISRNGDTVELGTGEVAELGGLTIVNGGYFEQPDPPECTDYPFLRFLVGAWATSAP